MSPLLHRLSLGITYKENEPLPTMRAQRGAVGANNILFLSPKHSYKKKFQYNIIHNLLKSRVVLKLGRPCVLSHQCAKYEFAPSDAIRLTFATNACFVCALTVLSS
jgi:hypothetical protein